MSDGRGAAGRTAAEALAGFAAALRPEDIPRRVRRSAALRVLDTLGCALAAADAPFARPALALVREWGGAGACAVWGSSLAAPPPVAALVNGCLAHGLDFDDTHAESITHASAVLVPAVLALGESRGLGGAEALAALVAGYEAVARLGMAAPGRFHERGWHATAVCGTFAAALAAGRCLGLPAARLAAALGIAGSMASGLLEFLEDGSWVKRLHPGWAAHSGIIAAGLAHGSFTGPATVLEGRFGFYRAALGESPEMDRVLKNLGVDWETLNISFKPYPCCHYNHAYVDAVRSLKARHGLAPDLVEEIQCLVPRGEVPIVCEPIAVKRRPRTDYDAKFSLPFAVAVALLDDHVGIGSFSAERLDDPRLLALADRVTYAVDPQSPFPRVFPGSVKVRLRDGRRLEARQEVNRGGPEAPLSEAEILAKFADNASRALPAGRVAALRDAVLGLEAERDLRRVLSLARIG